jgi:probable F420-dependent oxidoreductase
MKFGIGLPQRKGADLRHDVVAVAQGAEAAGFHSLWVYERLLFPEQPRDGLYGVPGLPWSPAYLEAADSLSVMAAASVVTSEIRICSGVLVAPFHPPVHLAKALATLDHLGGGGRLTAGLAIGWSSDELQAVGSTLADRAHALDELLDVLDAVWGPDPVSYQGERIRIDAAAVSPKPLGRIPVLLGGAGPGAAERVAARADGWICAGFPPDAAGQAWAQMKDRAQELGRDTSAMNFTYRANIVISEQPAQGDRFPFTGSLDQIVDDVVAISLAGADEVILELQIQDRYYGPEALLETATEIRELAVAAGAKTS